MTFLTVPSSATWMFRLQDVVSFSVFLPGVWDEGVGDVPVRVVVERRDVAFLNDAVALGEVLLGEGLVSG